jgi:hypothetical protein
MLNIRMSRTPIEGSPVPGCFDLGVARRITLGLERCLAGPITNKQGANYGTLTHTVGRRVSTRIPVQLLGAGEGKWFHAISIVYTSEAPAHIHRGHGGQEEGNWCARTLRGTLRTNSKHVGYRSRGNDASSSSSSSYFFPINN